ncbi:MAG: GNAT family N-acetyltransferase [Candidatus Lokiarchaeota archaeon]|nr:GNAT family N-acetyltransferase [Candidatus Lokiarchaeota archaeon]
MEHEEVSTFISGKNVDLLPGNNLEHLNLYAKWDNDQVTRHYARNNFPIMPEAFKKWIEEEKTGTPRQLNFEIWHKTDRKIIGHVGFNDINWSDRNANIGMVIGEPEYRSKDLGTEAAALIIDYGFNELNLFKIGCGMYDVNTASMKVAEKLGMLRELVLKEQAWVDGKYVDEYEYCIFRDEWIEKRKELL